MFFDGADEAFPVPVGQVALEFGVLPVGFEGRFELFEDPWVLGAREADIPLQAVLQGGGGHVGAAHIGGGITGMTMEEPGFGVQAGSSPVVGDFDSAEFAESVESLDVGGAHVGCGEDSQLAALLHEPGKGVSQQSKAAPFEKSAE